MTCDRALTNLNSSWIRNVTCQKFHRLFLFMLCWAKDNDVDVNSTYRSSNFLSTKIDGGMLLSF